MTQPRIAAAAALSLALAGCASPNGVKSDVDVVVQEPSGLEIDPEDGKGREVQVKAPFEGGVPNECGMQKDSFLLDVGIVRCANSPGSELSALFVKALREAGYKVTTGDATSSPTVLQLEGELLRLYSEPVSRSSMEADIQVNLKARTGNGLDAERKFYEKGRAASFQRAVNSAVRKMLQSMVSSVAELLDQYPSLGKPSRTKSSVEPSTESSPR